jgi:hypothetical protein
MISRPIVLALVCALFLSAGLPPNSAVPKQNEPAPTAKLPASTADAGSEVRFSAEIIRYQLFQHDIGHNMTFRLTPTTTDEGGGWVIEIVPSPEPAEDPVEFAAIATPPYHSYNDRYVAAAFGYSAKEAIKVTTRKFNFVQSVIDEQRASEVVNAGLYPSTVSESDKARIANESADINLGTGELHILGSRITPAKAGSPDTIASIKFEVVLNFSPGLTLQQVLAPHAPTPKR